MDTHFIITNSEFIWILALLYYKHTLIKVTNKTIKSINI